MNKEEFMEEFIRSKGLWEEFDAFATKKQADREEAIKKIPVGDLTFDFDGHRSRYCYECSGSNFDEGGRFLYVLKNFFEMDFVDPSSNDDTQRALTKDEMEGPSLSSISSVLDEVDFEDLFESLMSFIDHKNETFTYFLCDNFGFVERTPSREEIKEWLGNLLIDRDDADAWRHADFEVTY